MAQKYHIGDLVWAKLKGQSPWPGRVSAPPPSLECGNQTSKHYCVYFFGVKNYEWVLEKSIKPYEEFQEEMMKYCTTVSFRDAVTQIVEYLESPEKFPELCNDTVVKEELLNDAMEVDMDNPLEAEEHNQQQQQQVDIDNPLEAEEHNQQQQQQVDIDNPLEAEEHNQQQQQQVDIDNPLEAEGHNQQQQQHKLQDGDVDIDTKDVKEATDTIPQDAKLSMATKVMLPRISVHECENCAVCFLDQEAFEKHKLTHIEDPIDDNVPPAKRRKVDDSFNNNSNICDRNESDKSVKTITFNFMDNELQFDVKKNGQVKVPAMLNPRVALDRIEAHGCEFCNQYFVDLHEYQRHKLSHLKSGRFKVRDKDVTIKSQRSPSFRCYCGIRFTDFKDHNNLVDNSTVSCKPHTSSVKLENISEQIEEVNIKAKQNKSALRSIGKIRKMFIENPRYINESGQIEPINDERRIQLKNRLDNATVEEKSVTKNCYSPQLKSKLQVPNNKQKAKKRNRPKLHLTKCQICEKSFRGRSVLERHLVVHTNAKPYSCDQCGMRFAQRGNMRLHLKLHAGIKEFVCQYCPKAFAQKGTRTVHERTHTGHKPYSCNLCPMIFSDPASHRRHVYGHAEKKTFECDICFKCYINSTQLRLHKITHDKIKSFECDICFKRLASSHSLRNHVKYVHTQKKERKFECDICGTKRSYKGDLIVHIQAKHEIKGKLFYCDLCPKQFRVKKTLNAHKRAMHGTKKFECDYCGKIFCTKGSVSRHINSKHAIEIFCHICLKRFTKPSDLMLHKKQSCSAKVFKCDICDKQLSSNKCLRKHKKFVHFGFKLECDYCGAKYKDKKFFINHIQNVHKKELNLLRRTSR